MLEGQAQQEARSGATEGGEEATVILRKRARSQLVPMTQGVTAVLTVLEGRHHGDVFALQCGENLVGRGQAASIHLDDHGVSRRHAQLWVDVGGLVVLLDLGSTNGTFVNGERVDEVSLKVGDRIRVGFGAVLELRQVTSVEAPTRASARRGRRPRGAWG